jgi:NitT/TauT family transport system ATP-binding protein
VSSTDLSATPTRSSAGAGFAVEANAVAKTYPNGTRALDPVDLQVREGEFVTLLGPSGCGKSTLLRLVAGLLPPSAGSIRIAPQVQAAGIGFVFQSPTLMPWASLEANVRLPLVLEGAQDLADPVRRALELVGLGGFARAFPRELSGGMQMRASLARALVKRPRLLLMDEPFGALDEITRHRLDRELSELCAREQLTVLFVTHSIYEAVFLSSRVLVMSARPGRIIGEIAIDEPPPRQDGFRNSARFSQLAGQLSALLASGFDEVRT